jgi:glycosyltransferase involved in cell wall biosynthesis
MEQARESALEGMCRPLRVLQVIRSSGPYGASTNVLRLVRDFDRAAVEAEVAVPPRSGLFRAEAFGVRVHELPMTRDIRPLQDLSSFVRLRRLLQGGHYDIVHVHSSKAGFLARAAAASLGLQGRVVYSPRAYAFLGRMGPSSRVYLALERLAKRWCAATVAVSWSEAAIAETMVGIATDRIHVIPNGIESRLPEASGNRGAELRCSLGLPQSAPLVLFVGRLAPQKDPITFLRTARLVGTRHPECRFLVVGDGPLRRQAEGFIKRCGLSGQVVLLGERRDVPDLLREAHTCVSTSSFEGLPTAILESFRAAVPMVATDVPGNRDLVEHGKNGLLVPPGDVVALAESVVSLLEGRDTREAMSIAAKETFDKWPSPIDTARSHVRLYQGLAARAESAPMRM